MQALAKQPPEPPGQVLRRIARLALENPPPADVPSEEDLYPDEEYKVNTMPSCNPI